MIEVCTAPLRDMPHVIRLDTQTQEFALDVNKIRCWFMEAGKGPYIARLSGREIGFALAIFNKDKDTVFIDRVGAHPSFRRVGVGRKIVEHITLDATTGNIDKIQMIVPSYIVDDMQDPWNIEQWLWKLGFKAGGTLTDHFHRYNRDYDGYIFQRMKP